MDPIFALENFILKVYLTFGSKLIHVYQEYSYLQKVRLVGPDCFKRCHDTSLRRPFQGEQSLSLPWPYIYLETF